MPKKSSAELSFQILKNETTTSPKVQKNLFCKIINIFVFPAFVNGLVYKQKFKKNLKNPDTSIINRNPLFTWIMWAETIKTAE